MSGASFQDIQRQLAGHIRSRGQTKAPDGSEETRLKIYRELFYNNVKGFLDGGFPVCRSVLGEEHWQRLATAFFSQYQHQTPYFLEIAGAFLDFLNNHYEMTEGDPVWLCELAHYEWLELVVDVDPSSLPAGTDVEGDVLQNIPVPASACQGFLYQYPVHTIAPENSDPAPRETALVVFRDSEEQVRFVETNPFTLGLLGLVVANPDELSGLQLVESLLRASGMALTDAAMAGGCQILQQWRQQGVLAGSRMVAI